MAQSSKSLQQHNWKSSINLTENITPDHLAKAVLQQRYADVQYMLSDKNISLDPNIEITFLGGIYMTSLEFSVFRGDWEMALLLFLNGADPMSNCFDGTMTSYNNSSIVNIVHASFKNRKCIPGFRGLRVLNDSKVIDVCLWLMELVHDGSVNIDSTNNATVIMECIMILLQDLAKTHDDKRNIICHGAEYIRTCYEGIRFRTCYGTDHEILDDELFELILFSLRMIVQRVICT